MITKNYNELINDQIREYPVKSFVVDAYQYGYRFDYKKTRELIDNMSMGMLDSIPRGSVVSALPLNLENALVQLCSARASKQSVFLDCVITAEKLETQFAHLDPGAFIVKPTEGDRLQMPELRKFFPWLVREDEDYEEKLFFDRRYPNLKNIFQMDKEHHPNTRYMRSLVSIGRPNDDLKRVVKKYPLGLKSISSYVIEGSTPIGLSQYNIINTGNLVGKAINLSSRDIVLTTVPMHLSAGLSLGLGMVLANKAQITYAHPEFNPEATFNVLDDEYVTTFVCLASQLEALLNTETRKKASNLEKMIIVTTPEIRVSQEHIKKVRELWRIPTICVVFGNQRTGGVISHSVNSFEEGNAGELLANTTAKTDSNGELSIKGFNVENDQEFIPLGIKAKLENNKLILSE